MPHKLKESGGPLKETKAYLIISIRQLKRNYIRQLKNLHFDINELKYNARHACYRITIAVKSSQPHEINELLQNYKNQLLSCTLSLFLCFNNL